MFLSGVEKELCKARSNSPYLWHVHYGMHSSRERYSTMTALSKSQGAGLSREEHGLSETDREAPFSCLKNDFPIMGIWPTIYISHEHMISKRMCSHLPTCFKEVPRKS